MVTLHIELSEDFARFFESMEEASDKARESLILQLVREERMSQGKAAELLGISRAAMLDLAARNDIPFGGRTYEELQEEVAVAEEMLRRKSQRAHH